jgi:hypothetical protein
MDKNDIKWVLINMYWGIKYIGILNGILIYIWILIYYFSAIFNNSAII